MAGFLSGWNRKTRPGVYIRITNRGNDVSAPVVAPINPPAPGGSETALQIIVSPKGVMYAEGPALFLAGSTVVIQDKVDAVVHGETLVIEN